MRLSESAMKTESKFSLRGPTGGRLLSSRFLLVFCYCLLPVDGVVRGIAKSKRGLVDGDGAPKSK